MVQPINYILPDSDIMSRVVRGYETGLDIQRSQQEMDLRRQQEMRAAKMHPLELRGAELGLTALQQGLDAASAREAQAAAQFELDQTERKEALERQAAYRSGLVALAQKGKEATFDDYFQFSSQFPEMSAVINETWQNLDENRKQGTSEVLGQVAAALRNDNVELAIRLGNQYADAAENSGDAQGAATARAMVQLAQTSPEAALASLGVTLVGLNEDIAKQALGDAAFGGGRKVSRSQLFKDGTSLVVYNDGSTEVKNPQGNIVTGEEAQEVLAAANRAEIAITAERARERTTQTLEAQVEGGSQVEAAKALGKVQGKFVESAFEGADGIASSINNIQTAINALDAGARAGAVDKYLPNVTKASATLRNAMDRMGLDVIGSVTFGALSEGELNLAMETAVPRNLNEADLRTWLANKLESQRKVRSALLEQAQFLSNPRNTLEMWANRVGAEAERPDGRPSYLEGLE